MITDESTFQKILQFLLEKEDHIIMIGTGLPDVAISARGLTNTHRKQLKTDANFIYNQCLLPIFKMLDEKNNMLDLKKPLTLEEIQSFFSKSTDDQRILKLGNSLGDIWDDLEKLFQGVKPTHEAMKTSKKVADYDRDLRQVADGKPMTHVPTRLFMAPPIGHVQSPNIYIEKSKSAPPSNPTQPSKPHTPSH